jgi:hypothetical protein
MFCPDRENLPAGALILFPFWGPKSDLTRGKESNVPLGSGTAEGQHRALSGGPRVRTLRRGLWEPQGCGRRDPGCAPHALRREPVSGQE